MKPTAFVAASADRRRTSAFTLITTLIIVAVLAVAVVGFLSSMIGERQTADAFTSKSRAEDAAQTGAHSAMAVLAQSFRDFPDSATAWDTMQSSNADGTFNEGTSLYLRAVPETGGTSTNPTTVPNPSPSASTAANDPSGNGPNNPNRSTFVLPLVSGVPNGAAQLISNKAAILPSYNNMQSNPALQTYTDLNVRRFGPSTVYPNGDVQGVIGSPPNWTGTAPKPVRAPWVNITDSSGNVSARYAFWVEDESFRANVNYIGDSTSARVDNTAQPTATPSGSPRSLLPGDTSLAGVLLALNDSSAGGDSMGVIATRAVYPNAFFPDPLAFQHSDTSTTGASAMSTALLDPLRYVTSVQSSTLNLSRHGTQRLNIDTIVQSPTSKYTLQNQIDAIVQTIGFHLPSFGQRFYRTTTDTSSTTLNDGTQVPPGRPLAASEITARTASNSMIYLYKIATNIHDYMDGFSTQPTLIAPSGTVVSSQGEPTLPLGDDGSANAFWAQGKKNTPYIQEIAARYRPIVATSASPTAAFNYPRNHFDLCVDYYIELWNMSDQDIYAMPQSDPTLPHLNNAHLIIRDQQPWSVYPSGSSLFYPDTYTPPAPHNLMPPGTQPVPSNTASSEVLEIDLTSAVSTFSSNYTQIPMNGGNTYTTPDGRSTTLGGKPLRPSGVIFPAGSVTVITTDPSCFLPVGQSYPSTNPNIQQITGSYAYRPLGISPAPTPVTPANPAATFLCQNLVQGDRHFVGTIESPSGGIVSTGGLQVVFSGSSAFQVEASLVNSMGYLDIARDALAQYGGTQYANTFKYIAENGYYNDFSYVSSLAGNAVDKNVPFTIPSSGSICSELGDPRTNNEQLSITAQSSLGVGGSADQSRFFASSSTLGYVNSVTVRPDGSIGSSSTLIPASSWPDYYSLGAQGTTVSPGLVNAPAVIAAAPLTSIGQLGDVFDPARLPANSSSIAYSRGGGRTLKIGQHDDRYSSDPTGNASPNNTAANVPASNGWASWRLADIFSADPIPLSQAEPIELPGRININGAARDGGAALQAALTNFNFQPGTTTDPLIHGDAHSPATGYSSLAGQTLSVSSSTAGLQEIVKAITARLNPASGSTALPAPFFERGELGELADTSAGTPQYLFGNTAFIPPPAASSSTNANVLLVNNPPVDMNATFDRGREELFRRLSELICTRGDTFTVYAVGEALTPLVGKASPFKITSTQRMRVTFRLTPMTSNGTPFHPAYDSSGNPVALDWTQNNVSTTLASRFAKPDHYDIQVLSSNTY
jgi:hypothetical protein